MEVMVYLTDVGVDGRVILNYFLVTASEHDTETSGCIRSEEFALLGERLDGYEVDLVRSRIKKLRVYKLIMSRRVG
jgi:hypothetical protein